jgi:YHS domain-containing protein
VERSDTQQPRFVIEAFSAGFATQPTKLFFCLNTFSALAVSAAFAQSQSLDGRGVALKGYDPVSYFVDGKPMQGMEKFMAKHDGATYHFSSEKNRDMFVASPAKFAPQYGGFCAFGAAKGGKFEIDPVAYTVVDNKLYLNKNKDVQKWPQLSAK